MRSISLPAIVAGLTLLAAPAFAQNATATVNLMDPEGNSLGTLTLTEQEGGVRITGELSSVPNGEHGFHFHETGTCDPATSFESAGSHFDPGARQHGHLNPEGPHAGDMLNVTADDDGNATVDLMNENVTLSAGEASLDDADGSAIVLHADADDYMTDPSGNSGDRIACGVVETAD